MDKMPSVPLLRFIHRGRYAAPMFQNQAPMVAVKVISTSPSNVNRTQQMRGTEG